MPQPMTGRFLPLAALAVLTATSGISAQARALGDPADIPSVNTGVQLAQAREVEIVIDEYGRELIVDRWTGEVLAVRGARELTGTPAERRAAREYELGRDGRPVREPLGQRLSRELESLLGRREPRRGFDPEFRPQPTEPEYEARRDVFPEPPGSDNDMDREWPERYPYEEPAPDWREPGTALPGRVDRAPLDAPNEGSIVSLPDENRQFDNAPAIVEPVDPGARITSPVPGDASEDVARIQVLLDRAGLSPGVIDGRMGDNVNKALSAYRDKMGQGLRTYDPQSIEQALEETGGPAFADYTIQPTDAAGPFVASVPEDYSEKAKLDRLGYTSVTEMLAERFHMDENYLKALNPQANFNRPGTVIKIVNAGEPVKGEVVRIVADKAKKQVRAFDSSGRLVVAYPATIGSSDTPSPSGTHTVERIAFDPGYTYNPKLNFKQGNNDQVLSIPPGPNGPVGSIWIALSKPTYGIHGTPEPSKIGKTESHGCVRLTNWDATELAKLVKPGVTVEFAE